MKLFDKSILDIFEYTEEKASGILSKRYTSLLIITLVSIAVFLPTFSNELMTGWDDQWQVVNTYTSSGFSWENMWAIFSQPYHGQYSPINQCVYTLIFQFGGFSPVYYHATFLFLHIFNACLVYIILKKILLFSSSIPTITVSWITFLVTLIFSIHPLQVESVAWVSASKIVLFSCFYLLATYTFIEYIQKSKIGYYLLTLLFFICAYGSKEQAVIFPAWLMLLCVIYKVDLCSWKTWLMLLPFFVLAIVFGLMVMSINSTFESNTYLWWQRIVFCCYSLVEYFLKWFLPYKLLYNYSYPMNVGESLPQWLLVYPLILTVLFITLSKYLKHWVVLMGGLFFLIHISFVLHIIPISRLSIVADRYVYIPSIGFSFIAIYFFSMYYTRCRVKLRMLLGTCVLLIFFVLGFYSNHRTRVWHDTDSLRKELKKIEEKNNVKSPVKELY